MIRCDVCDTKCEHSPNRLKVETAYNTSMFGEVPLNDMDFCGEQCLYDHLAERMLARGA